MNRQDRQVAIVGAGPAGLVSARFLKGEGFEPVIFDAGSRAGGQWDRAAPASGIWPGMRTNTSRALTRFSDLDYPEATPAFPDNRHVGTYLVRYAEQFELTPALQSGVTVESIRRETAGSYVLGTQDASGIKSSRSFARVVVASGRYNQMNLPKIDGLSTFGGAGGVSHSFHYKTLEDLAGARVLVAGSSISALEIAADLVHRGVSRVAVAMRRQRYVVPKLIGGIPADNAGFTRFGALAAESFPPAEVAATFKAFLIAAGGDPAVYGAASPADDVAEAGITLSQDYLPLLAEGRLMPKPWMTRVAGRTVWFQDGTADDFDTIIMATGYQLSLPFLAPAIRRTLALDERHIDLAEFTFHPDLDGFAFIGLYPLIGPYFPVLELQARWIAYSWSGSIAPLSHERLSAAVADCRIRRGGSRSQLMHLLALRFARLAGVDPRPARHPDLARALVFGPLTAVSFRLEGPGALLDAADRIGQEAARHGAIVGSAFTPVEIEQLKSLGKVRRDLELTRLFLPVGEDGAPGPRQPAQPSA